MTHHGRHFQLENVSLAMRPVQAGGVPLLMAGSSDAALRRAGVQSDGWINGGAGSPEELRQRCEAIVGYAAEAGRDWDNRPLGKIIYMSIDDSRERSRERLFATLTGYYGRSTMWIACAPWERRRSALRTSTPTWRVG